MILIALPGLCVFSVNLIASSYLDIVDEVRHLCSFHVCHVNYADYDEVYSGIFSDILCWNFS